MHVGVLMRVYEDNIASATVAANNIIYKHSYDALSTTIYIKHNVPISIFKKILDKVTDDYKEYLKGFVLYATTSNTLFRVSV